ncbi:MAG: hypothetical protein Q4D76_08820 [Oscillospiraceae bacterium]|nr:hypothetical protein [Oscillospiraceae bacterium]
MKNCFNKKGEFIDKNYDDPDDYTYGEIFVTPCILFPKPRTITKIAVKTDGLLSKNKFSKIKAVTGLDNITDKEIYFIFRESMNKTLIWPCNTWSINQARRSYGNDDRLDMLLYDIELFYRICNKFNSISTEFINEIYAEINPSGARAFLNMPTLMWLCQYDSFNSFVTNRKLECFVDEDKDTEKESVNYKATIWENYYQQLYERTINFRTKNEMNTYEEYTKTPPECSKN